MFWFRAVLRKNVEVIVTSKTTLIFRSAALAGAISAALMLSSAVVSAQAPRPDFPGAKQGETQENNSATAPRPDFPGAKQGDASQANPAPRPDLPGPKQGDDKPQK
jgi:hypothetical protein